MISLDEFKKIDFRIGKIVKAEHIEESDKLLRLEVDLGADPSTDSGQDVRRLVAGIAQHYAPDALIDREIIVVANLEPRMLKGVESQGMLLAADVNGEPILIGPDREVPPGSTVK